MKIRLAFLFLAVANGASVYASTDTTTVLPFLELSGAGQGDVHRLKIDGLPSISSPTYVTAGLASGTQKTFLLSAADGDPFALPNPSSDFLLVPTAEINQLDFGTLE